MSLLRVSALQSVADAAATSISGCKFYQWHERGKSWKGAIQVPPVWERLRRESAAASPSLSRRASPLAARCIRGKLKPAPAIKSNRWNSARFQSATLSAAASRQMGNRCNNLISLAAPRTLPTGGALLSSLYPDWVFAVHSISMTFLNCLRGLRARTFYEAPVKSECMTILWYFMICAYFWRMGKKHRLYCISVIDVHFSSRELRCLPFVYHLIRDIDKKKWKKKKEAPLKLLKRRHIRGYIRDRLSFVT